MYLVSFKLGGSLCILLTKDMHITGYSKKEDLIKSFGIYEESLNSKDSGIQMQAMTNMLHYQFTVVNFPYEDANALKEYAVDSEQGIILPEHIFGGANAAIMKETIIPFQEEEVLDLLLDKEHTK